MVDRTFFSFLFLVFLGLSAFPVQSCRCESFDDLRSKRNSQLTSDDKNRSDQKRCHFFYGEILKNDVRIEVTDSLYFCCDKLENTKHLVAPEIIITGRFLSKNGVIYSKGCELINTGSFICNRLRINGIEYAPHMTFNNYLEFLRVIHLKKVKQNGTVD